MEFLHLLEGLRTPFFDAVFQFFTFFGEETLIIVLSLLVFWCIDKRCGYFLVYLCFLGTAINQLLKLMFRIPRPWLRDPTLTIVESAREGATGYSFPSGHTQGASGLYLGVARFARRSGVTIACIVLTALVGLSRMYLGVHTPADVLVSLGVGVVMTLALYPLFLRAFDGKTGSTLILLGVLLVVNVALLCYAEFYPVPADAIAENTLHGKETAYKMCGSSLALILAYWLDATYIRFDTKAVWWVQLMKFVLGFAVVFVIRSLLKTPLLALMHGHPLAGGVRYFLMVAFAGVLWPMTFRFWNRLPEKRRSPHPHA